MIKWKNVKLRYRGTSELCRLLEFTEINGVLCARAVTYRNGKKVIIGAPARQFELI